MKGGLQQHTCFLCLLTYYYLEGVYVASAN
jgi:hypothetical protein